MLSYFINGWKEYFKHKDTFYLQKINGKHLPVFHKNRKDYQYNDTCNNNNNMVLGLVLNRKCLDTQSIHNQKLRLTSYFLYTSSSMFTAVKTISSL